MRELCPPAGALEATGKNRQVCCQGRHLRRSAEAGREEAAVKGKNCVCTCVCMLVCAFVCVHVCKGQDSDQEQSLQS